MPTLIDLNWIAIVVAAFVGGALGATTLIGKLGVSALDGLGVVGVTMLSDSLSSGGGWRPYFIQVGDRVLDLMATGSICDEWPE